MIENPKKSRAADGRFRKYILESEKIDDLLPLVHTTQAYHLEDILNSKELDPRLCEVFNEHLVYMYYGRPAYRENEAENSRLQFNWPIVFVFDPIKMESNIKRVMPFDSGAFKNGRYKKYFHSDSILKDFELGPSLESIKKILGRYYSDNTEYYFAQTKKNVEIPAQSFEAEGCHELARLPAIGADNDALDERSSTIEIQFENSIGLGDSLLAVIVPMAYMDDANIAEKIRDLNVKNIKTYDTLHSYPGSRGVWITSIYKIVRELYLELGYLR